MNSEKRYQKIKLLGKGGMGEVWQVHDRQLNRDWAMKLLDSQADFASRQAFASEVAILTKLNHPGIPRIVDKINGAAGVIMDLVEGVTLADYKEGINEERLMEWGMQLLHILTHIHAQGILYLDCKPANIMVDQNGQLHLVDFGIACWKQEQRMTEVHYGTVGFAPPEQYEPGILDERCDIYAFGKTMIALALGVHDGSQLVHLKGSDTALSAGLRMIIDGCVQADIRLRYPNVATLLTDWKKIGRLHQEIGICPKRTQRLITFCIIIGTICYFLSFTQFFQDHQVRKERYATAMREGDYSSAIALDHHRQEPFEQLYEAVFADTLQKQVKSSYTQALQTARRLAIAAVQENDLDLAICDDAFLYRMARDALLSEDEELLMFAETAVNHMEESNLRSLLNQLCQWRKDPLFTAAKLDESSATWMAGAKQDEHFIELGLMAAQLYELHSFALSSDGYKHWQLWMEQLDTHRRKQDSAWMNEDNLRLLYRLKADSYYQYGRYLKNSGHYEQAVAMFTRLSTLEEDMQKEGLADEQIQYQCGNACLYLFQEGGKQMEQLNLLNQAKAYYEAALTVQPDYPQAQRGLEDCRRLLAYWGYEA